MTLNEPTPAEVEADLIERGYTVGRVSPDERHNAFYHRRSGVKTERPGDSPRHGQLEVRRWDMWQPVGGGYSSYEVGATFSTPLGWLTMKFYGLSPALLLSRLADLEERVCQAQALWMGEA